MGYTREKGTKNLYTVEKGESSFNEGSEVDYV